MLRFAPSPTGFIHVGNARIAILNFIFSKSKNLDFFIRVDDTDTERSEEMYKRMLFQDLDWIGINYKFQIYQSQRLETYKKVSDELKNKGLIYPCYETPDELNLQRKILLKSGKPPIYDRASLKLSKEEKNRFEKEGRKPHWRFKLSEEPIFWNDLIHNEITFEKLSISDPVVIRSDDTPLFTLTSVIDDAEFGVTHILRGDDHITNTAAQIQLFQHIGRKSIPNFGHLPLVKSIDGESLSKRKDSLSLKKIRESGIQSISLFNMLSKIGTSNPYEHLDSIEKLIEKFDLKKFSKSSIYFDYRELERINSKYLSKCDYKKISEITDQKISKNTWDAIKPNIKSLKDINNWISILDSDFEIVEDKNNKKLIKESKFLLPEKLTKNSWMDWCKSISEKTGVSGKKLFLTLRLKITGLESGPEMNTIICLLGRNEILRRLQ